MPVASCVDDSPIEMGDDGESGTYARVVE